MAEVTRVPLQPLQKGSLVRLWLGILAVVLAGAALAWFTVPKGVSLTTITAGLGNSPQKGDVVFVKYVGTFEDGEEFDRSQDIPVPIPGILPEGTPMLVEEGSLISGMVEGLLKMQKGGKYTLFIPSDKAYGANPPPGSPMPPNANLIFEVELVDIMSRADAERRFATLNQMMEMAQQGEEDTE